MLASDCDEDSDSNVDMDVDPPAVPIGTASQVVPIESTDEVGPMGTIAPVENFWVEEGMDSKDVNIKGKLLRFASFEARLLDTCHHHLEGQTCINPGLCAQRGYLHICKDFSLTVSDHSEDPYTPSANLSQSCTKENFHDEGFHHAKRTCKFLRKDKSCTNKDLYGVCDFAQEPIRLRVRERRDQIAKANRERRNRSKLLRF